MEATMNPPKFGDDSFGSYSEHTPKLRRNALISSFAVIFYLGLGIGLKSDAELFGIFKLTDPASLPVPFGLFLWFLYANAIWIFYVYTDSRKFDWSRMEEQYKISVQSASSYESMIYRAIELRNKNQFDFQQLLNHIRTEQKENAFTFQDSLRQFDDQILKYLEKYQIRWHRFFTIVKLRILFENGVPIAIALLAIVFFIRKFFV